MLNNKIDAFSKAFQGMTVACARCHDHKLDAVGQRDYYALAGVFMSSRWVSRTLDTAERNRQVLEQLRGMKPELRDEIGRWWLDAAPRFPAYMRAAQARIDNSPDAVRPSEGLDLRTVDAWIRALSLAPDKKAGAGGSALRMVASPGLEVPGARSPSNMLANAANASRPTPGISRSSPISAVARPAGWSVDGVGLRDGPVPGGDFTVALQGPAAVGLVLPAGLYTNALSTRLNGALRTPYVDHTDHGRVSLEAAGGDLAAHRVVVDNGFLTERQVVLERQPAALGDSGYDSCCTQSPKRHSAASDEGRRRHDTDWVELATKASNPNFPPRVGLGGECSSDEQARDSRSWFGITRVVAHDKEAAPADELTRFARLLLRRTAGGSGRSVCAVVCGPHSRPGSADDPTRRRPDHQLAAPTRPAPQPQRREPIDLETGQRLPRRREAARGSSDCQRHDRCRSRLRLSLSTSAECTKTWARGSRVATSRVLAGDQGRVPGAAGAAGWSWPI